MQKSRFGHQVLVVLFVAFDMEIAKRMILNEIMQSKNAC